MRRALPLAIAVVLGVPCGALLAGCGSKTQTVSAAETPAGANTATLTAKSTTPTTSTSTTPAQTTTNGGSSAPATTRTAPEPAFTEQKTSSTASAESAAAAAAVLSAHGYSTSDTSVYHPNQTLRVLIGTRTGSTDGYGQQAFFFVDGRYIGTDSKLPSATVSVASQGETEVVLSYPLYRKGDPLSNPSGGHAQVHFQLNNGKLQALDPIPPASSSSGTSRQ
jgi:LppP/LprE lipoprotein